MSCECSPAAGKLGVVATSGGAVCLVAAACCATVGASPGLVFSAGVPQAPEQQMQMVTMIACRWIMGGLRRGRLAETELTLIRQARQGCLNAVPAMFREGDPCGGKAIELAPHQLPVLHPVRYDIPAQSLLAVLLVVLEVAFEPVHVAVAFEGEDVGADAIQEGDRG